MGSNHPISLRLKKYNGWQGILYKFQPKAMEDLASLQKNLSEIIHHWLQPVLISKPKFYYTPEEIKIKVIYYISPRQSLKGKLKKQSFRYNESINNATPNAEKEKEKQQKKVESQKRIPQSVAPRPSVFGLVSQTKNTLILENILKERTGTRVKLQLVRIRNPIVQSTILARFISISLRKFNISVLWRILLKKIKFKGNHVNLKATPSLRDGPSVFHYFDWNHLLKDAFFSREFYSYVNGLKLKISGRPSKRRGASRTKVKNYSKGSFKLNSINSLIDFGHIERKDKNGSQSIKVYTSTKCVISFPKN